MSQIGMNPPGTTAPHGLGTVNTVGATGKLDLADREASQQGADQDGDQYEPVSGSEFKIVTEFAGRVTVGEDGLANGGPVKNLSFGCHRIELTDKMIRGGFLSTKDYVRIMVKLGSGFRGTMFLTRGQQRRIKQLEADCPPASGK